MTWAVKVYLEGRSDVLALEALLKPLIDRQQEQGVSIDFYETLPGHRKESLLLKLPQKAVRILQNDPNAVVVAVPDLYPMNQGFRHQTAEELIHGLEGQFVTACKRANADARLAHRFKAFCFKYDLEALILAAKDQLASSLGRLTLEPTWTIPVEDQDNDNPPKRIVEALYREVGAFYSETIDAPLILGYADYNLIAEQCPQCFKPFVKFLENVGTP